MITADQASELREELISYRKYIIIIIINLNIHINKYNLEKLNKGFENIRALKNLISILFLGRSHMSVW